MIDRISFQGALGAYSHLACRNARPDLEPLPCPDFESAIAAVQSGAAICAMLPIDNTIAGRVADIHYLLPKSGLHIIGEHFQQVVHGLLGVRGAKIDDIKTITSHPHALPQCRDIIAQHNWQKVVTSDTAVAAREVAERGDTTWAAIASELAAEIYGLDILQRDIADLKHNMTRFIILSRTAQKPDVATPSVTSLLFRVKSVPAALYKALAGFAVNGINLTKLESYFVGGGFAATEFYAEIEAHADSPAMQHALADLNHAADDVTLLGTYPAHTYRK